MTMFSNSLLGTAWVCQDLEHISEGTAIRRLGDENFLAAEEDHERGANADCRDDVAGHKAQILLNVRDAS